jgi:hypothetical protein
LCKNRARAEVSGADLDQIASDMEYEAASVPILKATVATMVKEGARLVTEKGQCRYAIASAVKLAGERTYDLTVEKIYPNVAVVIVNDKWKTRLTLEEYNGSKALIKKNSRFKATADLYKMGGTLCIRVNEDVQILN